MLAQLCELTARMLSAARAEQWSEVGRLEIRRIELMEIYRALPPGGDIDDSRRRLTDILRDNQAVERLCEREREAIAAKITQLQQTKSACNAYASNLEDTGI